MPGGFAGHPGLLASPAFPGAPLASASPKREQPTTLPSGGMIEHTNLLPPSDYVDRHVVYLSRYYTTDKPIALADPSSEAERWVGLLVDHFGLAREDVLEVNAFRTPFAAPLVSLGYLDRLPPLEGPVSGLYVTTTAQIYPQDRGMDEGIKAGYRTAEVVRDTVLARPRALV